MELKSCPRCNTAKPVSEYGKNRASRDGLSVYCKPCKLGYRSRPDQLAATAARNAAYRLTPAQKAAKAAREKSAEIKARRAAQRSAPRAKERLAERDRGRRGDRRAYARTEAGKASRRRSEAKRYYSDPAYRLGVCAAVMVRYGLKTGKAGRPVFSLLGYSADELRLHLESLWVAGMAWENYGDWHVDHVKPRALFDQTDPVQFAQCWALQNLQPLWAEDNRKKSDSYAGA